MKKKNKSKIIVDEQEFHEDEMTSENVAEEQNDYVEVNEETSAPVADEETTDVIETVKLDDFQQYLLVKSERHLKVIKGWANHWSTIAILAGTAVGLFYLLQYLDVI